jgi:hypothetical protein
MILTDDEIRKAAEFAAEQMWPESGYVGWTEDDAVFHRKFIEACFEKLRAGVEVPESDAGQLMVVTGYSPTIKHSYYSLEKLLQYGDARALAAREQAIEEWRVHLLALWEKGDFDLKDALAASPHLQFTAYHTDDTQAGTL